MGRYAGLTLGPLLGGLLVASIGARWVFVANAVSYLISVALVASVKADFADPERDAEEIEEHKGLAAGFRFIRRDRVLGWLLISWVVFILGMASTLIADPVLADEFGGARSVRALHVVLGIGLDRGDGSHGTAAGPGGRVARRRERSSRSRAARCSVAVVPARAPCTTIGADGRRRSRSRTSFSAGPRMSCGAA